MADRACRHRLREGFAKPGDRVIIVAGVPLRHAGRDQHGAHRLCRAGGPAALAYSAAGVAAARNGRHAVDLRDHNLGPGMVGHVADSGQHQRPRDLPRQRLAWISGETMRSSSPWMIVVGTESRRSAGLAVEEGDEVLHVLGVGPEFEGPQHEPRATPFSRPPVAYWDGTHRRWQASARPEPIGAAKKLVKAVPTTALEAGP